VPADMTIKGARSPRVSRECFTEHSLDGRMKRVVAGFLDQVVNLRPAAPLDCPQQATSIQYFAFDDEKACGRTAWRPRSGIAAEMLARCTRRSRDSAWRSQVVAIFHQPLPQRLSTVSVFRRSSSPAISSSRSRLVTTSTRGRSAESNAAPNTATRGLETATERSSTATALDRPNGARNMDVHRARSKSSAIRTSSMVCESGIQKPRAFANMRPWPVLASSSPRLPSATLSVRLRNFAPFGTNGRARSNRAACLQSDHDRYKLRCDKRIAT
jgi:hypothetical protein